MKQVAIGSSDLRIINKTKWKLLGTLRHTKALSFNLRTTRDQGWDGSQVRGREINFTSNLQEFSHLLEIKKSQILLSSAPFSSSELHEGNYVYLKYNQLNHPLCSCNFLKVIVFLFLCYVQ
jgi:hypothetical protein